MRARRLERLARDFVGGPRPRRGIRRLVAHEPAISLPVEEREDLLERHAAAAGRQPVERLAGLEPGARHVAVLDERDLAERHVVDGGQRGAAPLQMVGVEQEPAARVRGLAHDTPHDLEVVELLGLRVELDGQLHVVRGRDVAGLTHIRRGAGQIAAAPVRRAHDGRAAELGRPSAGFGEGLQQPPALVAVGEHPAELHADAGDAEPARFHDRQHVGRRLPLLGGAGEVDATQLDAVPARRSRRAENVRKRRRVEGPGGEGQHRRHYLVAGRGVPAAGAGAAAGAAPGAGLLPAGGLALANSTACFSSPSACLTSSRALARCPPKWCSALWRWRSASSSDLAAAWIRWSPARVAVTFLSCVNARVPNPRTNPIASTLVTITLRFSMRSSPYTAAVSPPSKLMAVPVMYAARSEARKATRSANSLASPNRPSGNRRFSASSR